MFGRERDGRGCAVLEAFRINFYIHYQMFQFLSFF